MAITELAYSHWSDATLPGKVKAPTYEFEPDNAENSFEIETYFYGSYTGGAIPQLLWATAVVSKRYMPSSKRMVDCYSPRARRFRPVV